jgi:hypothetical protein
MTQVIDLRQQGPGTGAQIAQMGQQFMQFFMEKEKMALQKEALELQTKMSKFELEQMGGVAEAGRLMLTMQVQNDPQFAGMLRQAHPSAFDETGQFNAEEISPHFAAAVYQQHQQGRRQEAEIGQLEAQTGLTGAQADATWQAIDHAEALFPTVVALKESEVALNEATAALQRAQASAIPQEIAIAQRQVSVAEQAEQRAGQMFQTQIRENARALELRRRESATNVIAALGGGPAAEGVAARIFYEANRIPGEGVATRQEEAQLRGLAMSASSDEEFAAMLEDRTVTRVAQGLGLSAGDQAAATAWLERAGGDPQVAVNSLAERTDLPKEERARLIAEAIVLYSAMHPQVRLQQPRGDNQLLMLIRRHINTLGGAGAGAVAGFGVGGPVGAVVGGGLGATGGTIMDIRREVRSSRQTR